MREKVTSLTVEQWKACEAIEQRRKNALKTFKGAYNLDDSQELTEDLIDNLEQKDRIKFNNVCAISGYSDDNYYKQSLLDRDTNPYYEAYKKLKQLKEFFYDED